MLTSVDLTRLHFENNYRSEIFMSQVTLPLARHKVENRNVHYVQS